MVKKDQFTLLFVPYFEFRGTNYIRNLFRFCVDIQICNTAKKLPEWRLFCYIQSRILWEESNVMLRKEGLRKDMETEMVISDGIHIIVPMASKKDYHYFGLLDEQGKIIMENPFCGYGRAVVCAKKEFTDCNYTVKDILNP